MTTPPRSLRTSAAAVLLLVSLVLYLAYLGALPTHRPPQTPPHHTPPPEGSEGPWGQHKNVENRTPSDSRLMMYNRVPKCGSTTMQTLLRTLAQVNNFTHHSSTVYGQRRLTPAQEARYVQALRHEMTGLRQPLSVDRHLYFVDFARYNVARPVYINMIREPVQRFVSSFYYARSPERWERLMKNKVRNSEEIRLARIPRDLQRHPAREGGSKSYYHNLLLAGRRRELAGSPWANKNFSVCVLGGDKECAFVPGSSRETTVSFFCGSDPTCLIVNGAEALQRAKHNLETAYSVVGIVEELEQSMAVMEHFVPLYLRGMRRAFSAMREDMRTRNKTPHPGPQSAVRRALQRNMTGDIELYNFARRRLHQQMAALGISSAKLKP